MRLNLLMRDIRANWISTSLDVVFDGMDGWVTRWSEFAGSAHSHASAPHLGYYIAGLKPFKISLYCGLNILPSLFFATG